MRAYRATRDARRRSVTSVYRIHGFLSSGTYGRVYKAEERETGAHGDRGMYAIKKFKPDREGERNTYTGISQSAIREIGLNRELRHVNVTGLHEVMLENKAIHLVFEYAEHDFLQIIQHHLSAFRSPIAMPMIKSLLWQLLNGVEYLHRNWVMHRDLKPANVLVTTEGIVKIGDLGLARVCADPLLPLYTGDMVVVTIWYRAPELLLGARHYTSAIDLWAVGCIWGELLALRPMFKGEEARMAPKMKSAPFQGNQLGKIVDILGTPGRHCWPRIDTLPDYPLWLASRRSEHVPNTLRQWYTSRAHTEQGLALLDALLQYDPERRITARDALEHPWFSEEPLPTMNAFASAGVRSDAYPQRKVYATDAPPAPQGNRRAG